MRIIGPYCCGVGPDGNPDVEEVMLVDDARHLYYRSQPEPIGTFTMKRIWEEMRKAREAFSVHRPEPAGQPSTE